jgi:hypothetical protein
MFLGVLMYLLFPFAGVNDFFIGFIDAAGLYFAWTQLTHRNISQNHKFQAILVLVSTNT